MPISILESINWPGAGLTPETKKITGDDRFGFDESVGSAWVLDGATDLGPFRVFDKLESDAAWIAEHINRELMMHAPKADIRAYFADVLAAVKKRAAKASRVDLDHAPKEVLPIASGIWMWQDGETTHFARSGDCVALIQIPDKPVEVLTKHEQSELEERTSRELNAMSPDDRIKGLRRIRATQNTDPEHALLGLSPYATETLVVESRTLPEGSHVLLMSDGLWRLCDPYRLMSPQELMDAALENGVEALARTMRKFEAGEGQDAAARIKKTDDACGVLISLN